jgi:hypothetical protein
MGDKPQQNYPHNVPIKAKNSMVGMQQAREKLVKVVSQQFEFP